MCNVLSVVPHSPLKKSSSSGCNWPQWPRTSGCDRCCTLGLKRSGEQHSDAATTWGVFALPLRICVFHSALCIVLLHIRATEKDDLKRDLVTF